MKHINVPYAKTRSHSGICSFTAHTGPSIPVQTHSEKAKPAPVQPSRIWNFSNERHVLDGPQFSQHSEEREKTFIL